MKRKIEEMLFFWLNRRSQKKSYTWEEYHEVLKQFTLAKSKIYVII